MLNESGYIRPTYQELLDEAIVGLQERFGADIDVSPTSNFGILARFNAAMYNEIMQRDEETYNSAFVEKAIGVSLDRLAANFGVTRNPDTYAVVTLQFTGKAGFTVPLNTSYRTSDNMIFVLSEPVTLDSAGKGRGIAYANQTGSAYNVATGTITEQVQPISDIYTVTNNTTAAGGAERETDSALRERIKYAVKGINSATYNGIVSSVRAVAGVKTVRIVENKTGATDSYGNPPYSIHIYVLGGVKEDIAKAIFDSVAFGINTYGSIVLEVNDLANQKHTVAFDLATERPIYVNIKLSTNDNFLSNGVDLVKQQVKAYIETLTMGETVRFSFLYKYIYSGVVGIDVADVKIGLSSSNLAMQDLPLNPYDVASYNADNVIVTVV